MKTNQLLPVAVIGASLLLSACSGLNLSVAAPAAALANSPALAAGAPVAVAPQSASAQTAADAAGLQNAYEAVYQSANPSVVTIEISSQVTTARSRAQGSSSSQVVPTAEGSGFIWDSAGHIVTNNHVIEGAAKISVTFSDGTTYDAKLVGADPSSDLAVIQVTGAPAALLKPVTVANSSQVKVGQMVVAIGNPYGLANTMTTGIVSAVARSIQSNAGSQSRLKTTPGSSIPDVIQTDAAINPGNSGGVLLDMNGALIGVPSQIKSTSGSNSGVGFAIPSSTVSRVVPQLITKGTAALP